jgi:hypothetical protein
MVISERDGRDFDFGGMEELLRDSGEMDRYSGDGIKEAHVVERVELLGLCDDPRGDESCCLALAIKYPGRRVGNVLNIMKRLREISDYYDVSGSVLRVDGSDNNEEV